MNVYEYFGSLSAILSENESQLNDNIERDIAEYLKQLQLMFKDYFSINLLNLDRTT